MIWLIRGCFSASDCTWCNPIRIPVSSASYTSVLPPRPSWAVKVSWFPINPTAPEPTLWKWWWVCFCNPSVYTIMLDLFACSFLSWLQCSWAALSLFPTGLFSRHSLFPNSVSIYLQGESKNGKICLLRGDVFLATWRSWVVLLLHWDAGRLGRGGASWGGLLFARHLLGSHWIMGLLALNLLNWIAAHLVVESRKRFAGDGIKRFDHKTKVKARSERRNLQTTSQLYTKQVGTREINQIIESLLKVNVQEITKTY